MAEQTSGTPAEAKAPKAEYKRTQVKTRNPRPGVYTTLNQSWEIERVDGSKRWSVFQLGKDETGKLTGERDLAIQDAGTWDEALTAIVEKLGQSVEALNTAPAKPKEEAPKQDPPKPAEEKKATGRPRVNRGGRKVA
jgi:hypothetical protein